MRRVNANNYNAVGDTYSNSGGPGTSAYGLTVANSIGSTQLVDRVKILAPRERGGHLR